MGYPILLSSESGVICYSTWQRGPATLRVTRGRGSRCWTAPVWLPGDSVSLICINLHERCLIIFLPRIDRYFRRQRSLPLSLPLCVLGLLSFCLHLAPPVLFIANSRKKELNIDVKNVRKAHKGAGTYNNSHKMIHVLVSGGSQEALHWEYFPPSVSGLEIPS